MNFLKLFHSSTAGKLLLALHLDHLTMPTPALELPIGLIQLNKLTANLRRMFSGSALLND